MAANRPYRFGIAFGVLNVLAGVYYGWLAITAARVAGTVFLGICALVAVATGIGLLRKRRYGVLLLNLVLLLAVMEAVLDWFKPHEIGRVRYVVTNAVFLGLVGVVVGYFYKRRDEFQKQQQGDER